MCPDNWIHPTRSSHGDGCLRCHSIRRRGCETAWEMSGDRLETGASLSACKQPEHKWSSGRGKVLKRDPVWISRPPSTFFFVCFLRRVWNRWQQRSHDGEGPRVPSVRSKWLLETFHGTDKTHKDSKGQEACISKCTSVAPQWAQTNIYEGRLPCILSRIEPCPSFSA